MLDDDKRDDLDCRYNENKGYVVFSAMGMQMNHDTRIIQKNERIFGLAQKWHFFLLPHFPCERFILSSDARDGLCIFADIVRRS